MGEYPLPDGYHVRLGARTHRCRDGRTLVGGSGNIVRLHPVAVTALSAAGTIRVHDATSGRLARLLLERGLAEPYWETTELTPLDDLTLIVPVLDRPAELGRLLAGLSDLRVIVVDDGSVAELEIRRVARHHGATVLRHATTRGPAAARNTGLRAATTALVAFADSDVLLTVDALRALSRHFVDPQVGVVAPRVRALHEEGGVLTHYEAAASSLDLGADAALVRPHGFVSYVPSAMLIARKVALGKGFDESMPVAEDVDLVWRVGREWSVRYEPTAVVRHEHRTEFGPWFARRACYGTGAALLAQRHGNAVAPVVLTPWTAAVSLALLAQGRWSLLVVGAATVAAHRSIARTLTWDDHPHRSAAALARMSLKATVSQTAGAVTRHYLPLTVLLLPVSKRARRAYVIAAAARGLSDYRARTPAVDPLRWVALRALDDAAYAVGLWHGAVTHRSARALIPLLRRKSRIPRDASSPRHAATTRRTSTKGATP